jgi:hypothetical protein
VAWGQQCGLAGEVCSPGTVCVNVSSTVATCDKFCSTDADCTAPGGLCLVQLDDGSGMAIPGVTLCTANCNPITNAGCPVAGTACQLLQETMGAMSFLTDCEGAGTGTHNTPCDPTMNNCAPKFGCFNTGTAQNPNNVCLKYCNAANPFSCPGLQTCIDIGVNLGGVEYGACN